MTHILVDKEKLPKAIDHFRNYQSAVQGHKLLTVEFVTLNEYLELLQLISQHLKQVGANALLYLAAAVSDFYIPESEMVCNLFLFILKQFSYY